MTLCLIWMCHFQRFQHDSEVRMIPEPKIYRSIFYLRTKIENANKCLSFYVTKNILYFPLKSENDTAKIIQHIITLAHQIRYQIETTEYAKIIKTQIHENGPQHQNNKLIRSVSCEVDT